MMKIVGIVHKTGEYNGRAYDNFVVHVVKSDEHAIGGYSTETFKFRPASLSTICNLDRLSMIINREVKRISYDRYGNADYIEFA